MAGARHGCFDLSSPCPHPQHGRMPSRLIAIGDVHGCSAALDALLGAIEPCAEDRIVMLGDYVDRGPDSRGVIERLIQLGDECTVVPILGNHEEMMLSVLLGKAPRAWWMQHGGSDTLESYGGARGPLGGFESIPASHVEWLQACPNYYETDGWFFTHANYVATEPLDSQPAEALRWQSLGEHFPEQHTNGKRAVLGHTSQRNGEVYDAGHFVCIDTFCHGGGWLTAYEPETGQVWQASAGGRLREPGPDA